MSVNLVKDARKERKTAGTVMTSSYLTRPEIPLAAALSQMLESIEADLTDDQLDAIQAERLRWRAELIRSLLTPGRIT
jgi:hypothetical protein